MRVSYRPTRFMPVVGEVLCVAEVCVKCVKDVLESPRWTSAVMRARTSQNEMRLVCGNDGSEDLPHARKNPQCVLTWLST